MENKFYNSKNWQINFINAFLLSIVYCLSINIEWISDYNIEKHSIFIYFPLCLCLRNTYD